MAQPCPSPKAPRFRRGCRSRWHLRRSIRRPSQAPILVNISGAHSPRGLCSDPPIRIAAAGAPAPQRGEIRNPHRSARVARGFLLWRISYACRHPISFTQAVIQLAPTAPQLRTFIHVGAAANPCRLPVRPPRRPPIVDNLVVSTADLIFAVMNASPASPLITIDSNCVVGLFDRSSATATSADELRYLMRYALSGVIRIAVTTKVEVDFARDRNDERRNAMLSCVAAQSPTLDPPATPSSILAASPPGLSAEHRSPAPCAASGAASSA